MQTFPVITLPPEWDAVKDCEALVARSRDAPTHEEAVREEMRGYYRCLLGLLELSWMRFEARGLAQDPTDCTSPLEWKIAQTEPLVRWWAREAQAVRLLAALRVCAHVEAERERVVTEYCWGGEEAWMYPLLEATDYLRRAALLLAQA